MDIERTKLPVFSIVDIRRINWNKRRKEGTQDQVSIREKNIRKDSECSLSRSGLAARCISPIYGIDSVWTSVPHCQPALKSSKDTRLVRPSIERVPCIEPAFQFERIMIAPVSLQNFLETTPESGILPSFNRSP